MDEKEIMDLEQKYMASVYAKKPIVAAKGRGAVLWDVAGRVH